MAQKPSDWTPKDPGWTIHFMFQVKGPWTTLQKYDLQKVSDLHAWRGRGEKHCVAMALPAPLLLHSFLLGMGGSPLEMGRVCVGFMADFGKKEFWFSWPVISGKGKVSFHDLLEQDKG